MPGFRDWLVSPQGKLVAGGLSVTAIAACFWSIWGSVGSGEVEDLTSSKWFVDAKTKEPFRHKLVLGEMMPVTAPSGGQTGYPAELCFWTADGKPKDTPTPVLLNDTIGLHAPTFCPDCHRLVVGQNPPPHPGAKPPPTQAEYEARRKS